MKNSVTNMSSSCFVLCVLLLCTVQGPDHVQEGQLPARHHGLPQLGDVRAVRCLAAPTR